MLGNKNRVGVETIQAELGRVEVQGGILGVPGVVCLLLCCLSRAHKFGIILGLFSLLYSIRDSLLCQIKPYCAPIQTL